MMDLIRTFEAKHYIRAFGDGPRNFEPWSSDEDDTRAVTTTLLTTTPHPREDVPVLDKFSVHRCPTWRVFWWYWARTRDKASHDPIPIPLGSHCFTVVS
ncbi:hypothetical protein TNCV_740961 [Trichonephila clavipes]|nr:hypothetical protein TNCV_740961 [Trichonephila clavipes]